MPVSTHYSCTQCSFTSKKEKKLNKHILNTHPVTKDGKVSKKKKARPKTDLLAASENEVGTPLHSPVIIKEESSAPGKEKSGNSASVNETMPPLEEIKTESLEGQKTLSEPADYESQLTPVWQCPFCEPDAAPFPSLKTLSKHKKKDHKEQRLNCCLCDFSSSILKKWHRHLYTAHPHSMGPLMEYFARFMAQGS